ncbi:ABC transporter substrate-binding protein [Sphaerisporangium krabiense]|uniref:Multiple sugar transport system substrate-binding protein n=1 Tax=Sphaerisporangium krabiense TaxID=763782 RepID=A0A7W8ZAU1_9ACTN|nr:sugar ABC transporter substrate-binding protein [Sphaerisporangium krabiense]MBB5630536.1 multiple sugar transport system substrate-binding protein [Sphaerisporangium krabiense]GII62509.1 ABC transporter substrate-binding protein [Sphaerisporangium krabiense]
MKRAIALLALMATTAATAACSGSGGGAAPGAAGDDQVVLRWSTWGTADDIKLYDGFTRDFEKRHPNIKLKLESVSDYADYHPKLFTQLTSKTAPDVFFVGDDNIGKFVSSGVLTPLEGLLAGPDSKSRPEDFFEGIYGGAKKDGRIYGVPNDTNPEVLWFDKKALKEAGIGENPADLYAAGQWTMDKYLDMNARLKAAGKAGSIFWNWYGSTYSVINGFGGKVWDGGRFVATTDANARKALQTLAKGYLDKTFLSADVLPESNSASTRFLKHDAGFYAGGRWVIDSLRKGGELDDYDIVPFPSPDGKPMPGAVAASYMAINKDAKNAKAAFTFLTEFVSKEGQLLRLKGGGAVPSIKGAEQVVLDGYPQHAQTFLDVRDTGFANYPDEVAVPGLTAAINDELLKVWTGKVPFDRGMTELQKTVDGMTG